MVVHGSTVTRNANASQRRVASSIVVIDLRKNGIASSNPGERSKAQDSNEPEVISDVSTAKKPLSELKTGKELTASLPADSSLEAAATVEAKFTKDDSAETPGMIP